MSVPSVGGKCGKIPTVVSAFERSIAIMFRELEIKGFRSLGELRLSGLGRVNLLVGTNNSGKTSVLEAVEMLAGQGDLGSFTAGLRRRREQVFELDAETRSRGVRSVTRRLFPGFIMVSGSTFSIRGRNGSAESILTVEVDQQEQLDLLGDDELQLFLKLAWKNGDESIVRELRLRPDGTLS
ncbi:MAG: AAA family ATPase, partial [Thermoanaerobaculia bacterium]